eukprot:CAMPEP_0197525444 /NCGR_PEP_ID=MMETSP1318-20131121/12217_1 /TAXON_ID=552666 /ORGANISM="Partenskyella glossopodia, Strain RCC365" /LENGTH=73 /DNA_ID=CAMNT_0043078877 /DNA_START=226 /DNA_END=447 /DNA_ORIENTATION=-
MRSSAGILLTCDKVLVEFLLHLDQKHKFVIEKLDETHLFIENRPDIEYLIQDEMDKWQEAFSFTDDQEELDDA